MKKGTGGGGERGRGSWKGAQTGSGRRRRSTRKRRKGRREGRGTRRERSGVADWERGRDAGVMGRESGVSGRARARSSRQARLACIHTTPSSFVFCFENRIDFFSLVTLPAGETRGKKIKEKKG